MKKRVGFLCAVLFCVVLAGFLLIPFLGKRAADPIAAKVTGRKIEETEEFSDQEDGTEWGTGTEAESGRAGETEHLAEEMAGLETEEALDREMEIQTDPPSGSQQAPVRTNAETDVPGDIGSASGASGQGTEGAKTSAEPQDTVSDHGGGPDEAAAGGNQEEEEWERELQEEKERFWQGMLKAREEMDLEYTESAEGNIDRFISGHEEVFERDLSDYLYSLYEGLVTVNRVNIIEEVEESEGVLTYQVEVFAPDGNSEIFICSYEKLYDFYSIYPIRDMTSY